MVISLAPFDPHYKFPQSSVPDEEQSEAVFEVYSDHLDRDLKFWLEKDSSF